MPDCEHKIFGARVDVNRIENIKRFQANITIWCEDCKMPFRFVGLPVGLDLEGATTSVDGTEARLSIEPVGGMTAAPPIKLRGYRIGPSPETIGE